MMKLHIRNFRCYLDNTFVFEEPFTCVVGRSGSGKTTLLDAIIFAIHGKARNCSSLHTREPPTIELEYTGNIYIKRTKTNLFYRDDSGTFTDVVAQQKIDQVFARGFSFYSQTNGSLFFELAPRDQLEFVENILFNQEIDIKELKARFTAEKRALDGQHKELSSKRNLTLDFLNRIGPTKAVCDPEIKDEAALKHRRAFLNNRLRIYRSYIERRDELVREIGNFKTKVNRYESAAHCSIPYTREQLTMHRDAESKLKGLNWNKYMSFEVEECDAEIDAYEKEKAKLLEIVDITPCPSCGESLTIQKGKISRAGTSQQDISELLEDLGASDAVGALEEVGKQLRLYREFKCKREQIDKYKDFILPVQNLDSSKLLDTLKVKEKALVEMELLKEMLAQKEQQLREMELEAETAGVKLWAQHSSEVGDISELIENADLYHLRLKEEKISIEYREQLSALEKNAKVCAERQRGLARASSIFAETEQQYLKEMLTSLVAQINLYAGKVFAKPPTLNIGIESTSAGARKLKIEFGGGWTYDMFSGGEKARLNICWLLALANFQGYKLLLLDEVSRALDEKAIENVLGVLRAHFCGQIVAVEHQELVEGAPGTIHLI